MENKDVLRIIKRFYMDGKGRNLGIIDTLFLIKQAEIAEKYKEALEDISKNTTDVDIAMQIADRALEGDFDV